MIRTVIIDDDCNVRKYIKMIIESTENEFKVIGEADNGKEGLNIIEDTHPDILILDIEMPSLNGIELMQELEKREIYLRTLILSCHDEYEFVRQAMKLGAADYLLKHKMDKEGILCALRELQNQPYSKEGSRQEPAESSWQMKLKAFLSGTLSKSEYLKMAGQFADDDQYVTVCAIEIDHLKNYEAKYGEQKASILGKHVWHTLNKIKTPGYSAFFLKLEPGYYALLLVCEYRSNSNYEARNSLYDITREYISSVSTYCGITISIGVSRSEQGMFELQKQWESARSALSEKFYRGCGRTTFSDEVEPFHDVSSLIETIRKSRIELMSVDEVTQNVSRWFHEIKKEHASQNGFSQFFQELSNCLCYKLLTGKDNIFHGMEYLTSNLDTLETLDDYRERILKSVAELYDRQKGKADFRPEVAQAINYIEENYKNEITLDEIATSVHMSKTYFCNVFKKETGEKFSTYLQSFRLEKAKQLLCSNQKKIYDIAYEVGFQSHTYFNNVFKEQYGMTPKEYRKRVGE